MQRASLGRDTMTNNDTASSPSFISEPQKITIYVLLTIGLSIINFYGLSVVNSLLIKGDKFSLRKQ